VDPESDTLTYSMTTFPTNAGIKIDSCELGLGLNTPSSASPLRRQSAQLLSEGGNHMIMTHVDSGPSRTAAVVLRKTRRAEGGIHLTWETVC
jgi:hypothetical protein